MKVFRPFVGAWIEEQYDLVGFWINGCKVTTFEIIASKACQGEILRRSLTAVSASSDVIELMRVFRILFMQQAVFASKLRPLAHEPPESDWNPFAHGYFFF
jgi:hypothetical protein